MRGRRLHQTISRETFMSSKTHGARSHIEGDRRVRHVTPEYTAWQNMRARCYRSTLKEYPHYGGRGIRVCARWLHSFENFLADMGTRPSPGHTLDRKNTNSNYSPRNCRWATRLEQTRNRRPFSQAPPPHTRTFALDGVVDTLTGWASRAGIPRTSLKRRLQRGWDFRTAVTTPQLRRKS